ncbi:MAG: hypothetical protein JXB47_03765 [Anaerolineae bacterium]|nr:hypothetical protein [Anaerolineae bacterium]
MELNWVKTIIWILTIGSIALASYMTATPAPADEVVLADRFDLTPAFHMSYPEGWTFQSGGVGILLFAEMQTVFAYPPQPGPSLVVFRSDIYTLGQDSLEEALDVYLRRGPLRGDKFAVIEAISETTLDGRAALMVGVEGRQFSSSPLMRSRIIITMADDGEHYYIFAADAPAEDWEEEWPFMEAMLASADIRE